MLCLHSNTLYANIEEILLITKIFRSIITELLITKIFRSIITETKNPFLSLL